MQKLQTTLLQRYPAVEFIPYNPNLTPHIHPEAQESQQTSYYFSNDQFIKQEPMAFVPSDFNGNKVQRQTEEGTVQSLAPQSFKVSNISESPVEVTSTFTPENTISTAELNNTQASTIAPLKIEDIKPEENKSKPIYHPPTAQNTNTVSNIFTAINDMNEETKPTFSSRGSLIKPDNVTTPATTTTQEIVTKHYIDTKEKPENNEIPKEYKSYAASPFEKPAESVNIAYSLLRVTANAPKEVQNTTKASDEKVETTVKAEKEVHRERSLLKKGPVRFSFTDKRSIDDSTQQVVTAKIPPKSKLIFDDKTGEPILRVYASYVDNPARVSFL